MLRMLAPVHRRYCHRRQTLYHLVADMMVACLDWQPVPRADSVGTHLLHIAGVEDLLVSAIEGLDVRARCQARDWDIYRPGFPLELDIDGPRGHTAGYYMEILRALECRFLELLADIDEEQLFRCSLFYVDGGEFQVDGLGQSPNHDLLIGALQHEQYHRGQIALLRFLYRQSQGNG